MKARGEGSRDESLCLVQKVHILLVDKCCFHIEFSSNPNERTSAFAFYVFLWQMHGLLNQALKL